MSFFIIGECFYPKKSYPALGVAESKLSVAGLDLVTGYAYLVKSFKGAEKTNTA